MEEPNPVNPPPSGDRPDNRSDEERLLDEARALQDPDVVDPAIVDPAIVDPASPAGAAFPSAAFADDPSDDWTTVGPDVDSHDHFANGTQAPQFSRTPLKKRLVRRRNGSIGGVCDGVAHYLGTDVTPIRLLWALSIFAGGFGLLAYVIAWIVMPRSSQWPTPGEPVGLEESIRNAPQPAMALLLVGAILAMFGIDGGGGALAGLALLGVGVYLLSQTPSSAPVAAGAAPGGSWSQPTENHHPFSSTQATSSTTWNQGAGYPTGAAPTAAPPVRSGIPVFLVMLGLLTLVAALTGIAWSAGISPVWGGFAVIAVMIGSFLASLRSNQRTWPIVLFGFFTMPFVLGGMALASRSVDVDWDFGELTVQPTTIAELQESAYDLDTGELVLDLRQIDLSEFEGSEATQQVVIDIDFGEVDILLPEGLAYDIDADVGVGEIDLFGTVREGLSTSSSAGASNGSTGDNPPTITIDARVGVGSISATTPATR